MSNEKHVSLLFHKVNLFTLQTRLTDTSCYILVILGIVGNLLGLCIFSSSRRTWRISSVYACLAICSSITNFFCVIRYASILHSTSRHILSQLVGQTWWGCKIYEFTFSFRVISSWITLFWMFERLMCIAKRLKAFANRRDRFKFKIIIPIMIMSIILICVIGPPVYMYQPEIISNNDTMNSTMDMMYCEVNSNASIKWQRYFHEVHLGMNHFTVRCLSSELIPTGMVILFNSYIIYYIVRTCRCLDTKNHHKSRKEQSRTTSWMNIILILHSSLFLTSLLSHIVGHFTVVEAHEAWWVLLSVLINCSLSFYVYCLSGTAFRNEIRRLIRQLKAGLFYGTQTQQQHSGQNQRLIYEISNFQDNLMER